MLFNGISLVLPAGLKNRDKVKRQLEENGGVIKPRRISENDVVLFDPGTIKDAPGFSVGLCPFDNAAICALGQGMALDVRFVGNSIQAGVCERPADYTITPNEPVPLIYRVQGRRQTNPRSVAHHPFTDEDDMDIFRFLDKEIRIARDQGKRIHPSGMKIWEKAIREGIAPYHTSESMRTRFKNYIGPRKEDFSRRLAAERQAEARARTSAPTSSQGSRLVGRDPQERRTPAPGGSGGASGATPYDSRRLSESFISLRDEEAGNLSERAGGRQQPSSLRQAQASDSMAGKRSHQGEQRRGTDNASSSSQGRGNRQLDNTGYEDAEEHDDVEPFDLSRMLLEDSDEATQGARKESQRGGSTSSDYETIVCDTPPFSDGGGNTRKRARIGEEAGDASMVTAREGQSVHCQQPPRDGSVVASLENGNSTGNYYGGADSMLPPDLIPDTRSSVSSPEPPERRMKRAELEAKFGRLMRLMKAMGRKFHFEEQWVADILRWERGVTPKAVAVAEQLREMTDELRVPCSIVMKVYVRTGNVARTQEKVENVKELHKRTGIRYEWIVSWMEMLDYDVEKTEKYLGNRYADIKQQRQRQRRRQRNH